MFSCRVVLRGRCVEKDRSGPMLDSIQSRSNLSFFRLRVRLVFTITTNDDN
jgi:hypothetical protein